MLYPLTFHPIYQERIWGGRNLEKLYGKALPPGKLFGESWEITDRPEAVSVIANGPLAGKDLRWLMENRRDELIGSSNAPSGRFPLLVKILDAQEKLSLQVHPPSAVAAKLGGEPKTEMWYIVDALPEAELYVGLKRGVTRAEFEQKIGNGTVADCFHRIQVRPGDTMFLPSGRVHAIGGGNVIFEIQQNSNTTYRVFDWNRVDPSGKPRELHLAESLRSIDFNDFEPALVANDSAKDSRTLVTDPLFKVVEHSLMANSPIKLTGGVARVLGVISGTVEVQWSLDCLLLKAGQFCLLPACLDQAVLRSSETAKFLEAIPG